MIKQTLLTGAATLVVLLALTPALASLLHGTFGVEDSAEALSITDVPGIDLKTRDLSGILEIAGVAETPAVDAFPDLLRLEDHADVSVAPSVSREALGRSFVKKIGFGRVETVEIVTTASGVYSTDALDTPHVLYPGVTPLADKQDTTGSFFLALVNGSWVALAPRNAKSFMKYGSGFGTSYMTDGSTSCVSGDGYFGCF